MQEIKNEGELGGEAEPQTQLAVARVDQGPRDGEDRRQACTDAPGSIAEPAKALLISQKSTNKGVVWIVATGRQPGTKGRKRRQAADESSDEDE